MKRSGTASICLMIKVSWHISTVSAGSWRSTGNILFTFRMYMASVTGSDAAVPENNG